MPILLVFLIWYFGFARNNPNRYKKVEGKVGKIILALVLLSVFSSFIGPLLGISIALLVCLVTFSPIIALGYVVCKILGIGNNKKTNVGAAQIHARASHNNSVSSMLTRSVPKRKRIVEKFNKKYDLTLTEDEIDRIVDASYLSVIWENEIYEMQNEYDSIYQWYSGNTNWLRTYIKVFPVQNISSDIVRQKQICIKNFCEVFDEIKMNNFLSIDECIEVINEKYYSFFDETTLMIAYRFLESNGKHYDLPSLGLVRNESELDKLRRKYDATKAAEGYEQKEMDKRVLS